MNDAERDRVEYWGQALSELQESDEFVLVSLKDVGNGQFESEMFSSGMLVLPFARDVIDRYYQSEAFRIRGDDEDPYDDE